MAKNFVAFCLVLIALASNCNAQIVEMDFKGTGGFGLLPSNQVLETDSLASGGEIGGGLVYDMDTMTLSIEFSFQGLTEGLNNSFGGIHIHNAGPEDPFLNTGGIEFFLNFDAENIPIGSTDGTIVTIVKLDPDQEDDLLNRQFYINIHSFAFMAGELRGNLVPSVPNLGDVNGDGEVNLLDVQPFVDLLVGNGYSLEADANCDGELNLVDVAPFVALLTG